jgi:hypothetical protein
MMAVRWMASDLLVVAAVIVLLLRRAVLHGAGPLMGTRTWERDAATPQLSRLRCGPWSPTADFEEVRWPRRRAVSNAVWTGQASMRAFDRTTRPLLRRVTASLLLQAEGIDIFQDQDPGRAAALLGARAWSLVDPQREPSEDSHQTATTPAEVAHLLSVLEELVSR